MRESRGVRSVFYGWVPVNEATVDLGTQVAHPIFGHLVMDGASPGIKLEEDRYCRGGLKTPNLDVEDDHPGQGTVLKTELNNDS
jgi:hypothetical protein